MFTILPARQGAEALLVRYGPDDAPRLICSTAHADVDADPRA